VLPSRVGAHRILTGQLRGCRLVTSWRDNPAALLGYTERSLLRWLAAHVGRGETWLDIGAHQGYTALALSRLVGPEGRVFAFEPVLETVGRLAATLARNRLAHQTVVPLGLSAAASLTSVEAGLVLGMAEHGRAAKDTTTIFVAALDGIWDGLAGGRRAVHGVKVDVQGMEVAALHGMRGLLREFRPRLVVEFHAGADRGAAERLLAELGYALPGVPVDGAQPAGAYLDDHNYAFAPA
jgi:FkbM family methyltransferase